MANHHISSGHTPVGATDWRPYASGKGIYVDVNTSASHFSSTPAYITSLGGQTNHWSAIGGSCVYQATATGFRIFVRWVDNSPLTPAIANGFKWHINWVGMEI